MPAIPIEIQLEIIHHCLSIRVSPRTLNAVCKAWRATVFAEIHGGLVVHSLTSEKVDFMMSHFKKAGSRPLFLCLLLDWFADNEQDWSYIQQLSDACFLRIRSLGLRSELWLIQDLLSKFGPRLQVSNHDLLVHLSGLSLR